MLSWTQSVKNQHTAISVLRKSSHRPIRTWRVRTFGFIGSDHIHPQQECVARTSGEFVQGLCNCQGAFLRSLLHRRAACIASSPTRSELRIIAEMFG